VPKCGLCSVSVAAHEVGGFGIVALTVAIKITKFVDKALTLSAIRDMIEVE
jgi:hypothetical protein